MSDGHILVHQAVRNGRQPLLLFDSAGRHLTSFGRAGRGPGEFEGAEHADLLPGDSVWIYDAILRAVTVLSPALTFIRRQPFENREGCAPQDALGDGSVVLRCYGAADGTIGVAHGSLDGAGRERYLAYTPPQNQTDLWEGYTVIGVGRRAVFVGDVGRYEIRRIAVNGKLERIVRLGMDLRAPADSEVDRQQAIAIANWTRSAGADGARKRIMSLKVPARVPPWSRILEDSEGNLWAAEFRVAWDLPTSWMIFDPGGNLIGRAVTPAEWTPQQIAGDYMLVSVRDAEGEERVEKHRIVKPAVARDPAT
jgi:hypothetical protein